MSKISVALDCGQNGTWLDLPATAAELDAALLKIGGTDKPYSIGDYRVDFTALHEMLRGIFVGGNINEVNYLAARLAELPQEQITVMEAVMETPGALGNIAELIDFTYNPDFHELLPDVHTTIELAEHYIYESGLVNMPHQWKATIDQWAFGLNLEEQGVGVHTTKGFLLPTGEAWREVFEANRVVPPEYRIDDHLPGVEQAAENPKFIKSMLAVVLTRGDESAWLPLPATADELADTLAQIGGADAPCSIVDFRAAIDAPYESLHGMIVGGDLNEVNYLAARLAELPKDERSILAALMESPAQITGLPQLIDFTYNPEYFILTPGIYNAENLGHHELYESQQIQMPEAWKSAVDHHALGKQIAEAERGVFTSRGYINRSGEEWQKVFENTRVVPAEYRIVNDTISAVFDVQTEMQRLKDAGISMGDIAEELDYRDRAGDNSRWNDNLCEYNGDELSQIEAAWQEQDNYLATVEKTAEANYNQIDGILNNAPPRRADLTDGQTHDEIAELVPEAAQPPKDNVNEHERQFMCSSTRLRSKPSILGRLAAAVKEAAEQNGAAKEKSKGRSDIDR